MHDHLRQTNPGSATPAPELQQSVLPASFAPASALALYLHLPWCVRKCPYCDFNSYAQKGDLPESRYLDALCRDMVHAAHGLQDRTVTSIFMGGGTPSLFSPSGIGRLLERAQDTFRLAPGVEITLEANPGTAEADRFAGYRTAGVTRLSLGVQSFSDRALAALGRIHDGETARAAFAMARAAGFDSINLDLMYGLPNQTFGMAVDDLTQAFALEPDHISYYELTIEAGTAFARNPPRRPGDETMEEIENMAHEQLARHGYRRYEVSAYARRPEFICRHNFMYWQYGDYLGLGAGAHTKLTWNGRVQRKVRVRHPMHYIDCVENGEPFEDEWWPSPGEVRFEFFLNALRLADGFPPALYAQQTGEPASAVRGLLKSLEDRGLLTANPCWIRPTPRGYVLLNEVIAHFLPERHDGLPERIGPAA
jgi:oxygen-independent coproporphyrinogen-3 oxidase